MADRTRPSPGRAVRMKSPGRLSRQQADQVGRYVEALLAPSSGDAAGFRDVARRCAAWRNERGLRVREVAASLRVPQYRIKDIEGGSLAEVEAETLWEYVRFLGLEGWFQGWARRHRAVLERLRRG